MDYCMLFSAKYPGGGGGIHTPTATWVKLQDYRTTDANTDLSVPRLVHVLRFGMQHPDVERI